MLTDELFEEVEASTGFKLVEPGTYQVKCLDAAPIITVSKADNRMLNIRVAPIATTDGTAVNGAVIYHKFPFTGITSKGGKNAARFIEFFSALGLNREDIKALYESAETAEVAPAVGRDAVRATLTINGEPYSLEGKTFMSKVKTEEYEGKESNKLGRVWAITE